MEIISGKTAKSVKVMLYGVEGIGKTTFASMFPRAVFIDTEGSTKHMDVSRLPQPADWDELIAQVQWCIDHKDQVGTLIIDTADWADQMCQDAVVKLGGDKIKSIEDFGYGKGYTMVQEKFQRELINRLTSLAEKGVNIVITAHAAMRKVEQPDEMGAYDHWEPKCSKKITPILKEWADDLFFANYVTHVVETKDGKKKATGGKKRVMYTTHTAAWDAKNRHGLADELPFSFESVSNIIPSASAEVKTSPAPKPEIDPAKDIEQLAKDPRNASFKVPGFGAQEKPKRKQTATAERPDEMVSDDPDKEKLLKRLWELMNKDCIECYIIKSVLAEKGCYQPNVLIRDYPAAFIQNSLIGKWEGFKKLCTTMQENLPF